MSETAMTPGIYKELSFAEYAALPFINSGAIQWGRISPKHMRAALLGQVKRDDTENRKFGRAVHTRLLEPLKFASLSIATQCRALLKSGDRKGQECGADAKYRVDGQWLCGVHSKGLNVLGTPSDFIREDERQAIEAMAASLHNHPAMRLLSRGGFSECSIVWDLGGQRCKGRIDRLGEATATRPPLIIDVKKCQVGGGFREDCEKAITDYGYYVQMGMYADGIYRLTGKRPDCAWVFIEDGPPFDVQVIPADDQTIAAGIFEYKLAVMKYARCVRDGTFIGYLHPQQRLIEGGLTKWKRKEYEHDLNIPDPSEGGGEHPSEESFGADVGDALREGAAAPAV